MTKPATPPRAAIKNGRASDFNILERTFGGLPVIDATENLRVFVNKEDIAKSVRSDPKRCVYAQACKRLFGATTILFLRSVAYVDLPDENNVRSINRFTLTANVRKKIEEFDKTGKAHPGGFLLVAPPATMTLEGQRERWHKRKDNTKSGRKLSPYIRGDAIEAVAADYRLGTGMVHFTKEKRDA